MPCVSHAPPLLRFRSFPILRLEGTFGCRFQLPEFFLQIGQSAVEPQMIPVRVQALAHEFWVALTIALFACHSAEDALYPIRSTRLKLKCFFHRSSDFSWLCFWLDPFRDV